MTKEILPYLHSLQEILASVGSAVAENTDATMRIDLAKRLLNLMHVQQSLAPSFQRSCIAKLPKMLPEVEALLPESVTNELLLQKLRAIPKSDTPVFFNEFLELAGNIQRQLVILNTPRALVLCKSLLSIEADYCKQLASAVESQNRLTQISGDVSLARNARSFDEESMTEFIRNAFPDEIDVTISNATFVAGGYSKFTMDIVLANTKSLPSNIILRGDADGGFGGMSVVDEYSLIGSVYASGVCAPEPLAIDSSDKVFGSPFILMEKMPGDCLGHMFNIPDLRSVALVTDIAVKLAAVHNIPLIKLGAQINGSNLRSSENALKWIAGSEAAWKASNLPSTAFTTAFEWLRYHADLYDNSPRALVHGDYGLNNLLIEGDRVTGILDWEHAHIGNPAYDLGYFHPMASALASWSTFLDAYANTGVNMPDDKEIDYSILLGATRVGVMLCQVMSAFASDQETGIAATTGIAGDYYDVAVMRVSNALEKVI
tara:strand:+ start:337 stop:1800 length:1464 start_codon:yes stop_codon:yes gene_type:complete